MPLATSFGGGRGNGLAGCPDKINVSAYENWVTLGGFKKTDGGSPSQAQIDLSLANAMKLFWNFFKLHATVIEGAESLSINGIDIIGTVSGDEVFTLSPDTTDVEPKYRVCWPSGFSASIVEQDPGFTVELGLIVGVKVCRMYNGATTDETKFVGYGLESSAIDAYTFIGTLGVTSRVILSSYADSPVAADTAYGYTNLPINGSSGTIPFFCSAYGFDTRSATNRTATSDVGGGVVDSVEINSVEFYTY